MPQTKEQIKNFFTKCMGRQAPDRMQDGASRNLRAGSPPRPTFGLKRATGTFSWRSQHHLSIRENIGFVKNFPTPNSRLTIIINIISVPAINEP